MIIAMLRQELPLARWHIPDVRLSLFAPAIRHRRWDVHPHGGDHIEAVRSVRTWLVRQAGAGAVGASRILGNYAAFQEWYWERELTLGAPEDDIKAYPTVQMVEAMREWVDAGRPV